MTVDCDRTGQICTILIVDDSEADRLTYQRYLAKSEVTGCAILESDCGENGLEICLQCQPDVILLDYLLPDIDGLEFLQTLRAQTQPLPPVIMLTGQGDEQVAVEAMKMGVQDYLVKDRLNAELLSQAIRRVLTQQVLQQMVARQQQQQQLMADIALRVSQSLNLETILITAAEGVCQLLDCDRALIYRFESDMSGTVIAESVLPGWSASLGTEIVDTCFQENDGLAPPAGLRIFGVFQTLASRDTIESTGIGLSIVKKVVEQQGGKVTVQSAIGEGSTFAFTWPKSS